MIILNSHWKKNASAHEGYDKPNEVLFNAVKGISDVILKNGKINVDFADVKSVLRDSGEALMGIGVASGENKVIEALNKAISSPLLEEINLKNAHSLLVNFSGSDSMKYIEILEALRRLNEMINPNAFLKYGIVYNDNMGDEVMVTVIATGYSKIQKFSVPEEPSNKLEFIKDDIPPAIGIASDNSPIEIDFNDVTYDPERDKDYETPTFIRIKGIQKDDDKKNEKDDEITDNSKDEEKNNLFDELKKKKKKRDDEEDTSNFLRRLMD